jgi:D-alanine-D-alanine ligase
MKGKRIGVLMGGISAEREVSLNTGRGVLAALAERGHDVVAVDWTEGQDLTQQLRAAKVEIVWNALHGTYGEDGAVQGLLECLRIPYTGSGVLGSAVAMDKIVSKDLFARAGIPTPRWHVLAAGEDPGPIADALGWPCVVKPAREGSTVGVTIVREPGDLAAAVELAKKCHGQTLLETFIPGHEVSVGILDGEVLGTVEIRTKKAFYDYEAKYQRDDNEYLVPAPLDPATDEKTRRAGADAFRALGCGGHSRVDVRVDEAGEPWVLEVNTLPGMTKTSLLPKIARHAGMDYATLCERILAGAGLRE